MAKASTRTRQAKASKRKVAQGSDGASADGTHYTPMAGPLRQDSAPDLADGHALNEWVFRLVRRNPEAFRPVAQALSDEYSPEALAEHDARTKPRNAKALKREDFAHIGRRLPRMIRDLLDAAAHMPESARLDETTAMRVLYLHFAALDVESDDTGLPLTDWKPPAGSLQHPDNWNSRDWHEQCIDRGHACGAESPDWATLVQRAVSRLAGAANLNASTSPDFQVARWRNSLTLWGRIAIAANLAEELSSIVHRKPEERKTGEVEAALELCARVSGELLTDIEAAVDCDEAPKRLVPRLHAVADALRLIRIPVTEWQAGYPVRTDSRLHDGASALYGQELLAREPWKPRASDAVRAPQVASGGEAGPTDDEQPKPLSRSARLVIRALDTFTAETLAQYDAILRAMPVGEAISTKKIGKAVRDELIPQLLVERPRGEREGVRLTTKGRRLARSLDDSD